MNKYDDFFKKMAMFNFKAWRKACKIKRCRKLLSLWGVDTGQLSDKELERYIASINDIGDKLGCTADELATAMKMVAEGAWNCAEDSLKRMREYKDAKISYPKNIEKERRKRRGKC